MLCIKPWFIMQTEWAVEKDWEVDKKTGKLVPAATQHPFDAFQDAYGGTRIHEAVSIQEFADGRSP
jgi:hypothetical protein